MSRPVALITGASSGIGAELARVYANEGYDLIVTARREERLEALRRELASIATVHCITADLATLRGPKALHAQVLELGVTVDTLVNNAGLLTTGPFGEASHKSVLDLLHLNVRALTELTHLFLPEMLSRRRGRILNIASVSAFQPIPGMALYGATKAFVLSFTESLSEELRGSGVSITALCPGPTRTEMTHSFGEQPFGDWFLADAAAVAREGYDACEAREVIRVPGLLNQALAAWSRYQPRWLVRAFSGIAARNSFIMQNPDR